ncbi:helix-turn-helix domain-containing protein [Natronococcus sp. A-GB1]|uniref:helix-turn-helix domain-containing protein n=1 Tax=Natronococcus sp. A-GB1 TaxID=3037648 RepID=UPI00241F7DEC|nr:helix-turn-helix domain-containing protein [Natronococcus sp. A-GB1]MDG5760323.1 helix-turn-helix domain-containing protein [Natronococcus sp. A-GB1]
MSNDLDENDSDSAADETQQKPMFSELLLEMDTQFLVLSHPRRRYLLYTLAEQPQWSLRELATKIAAWEGDISEETVTADERDKVHVSLMHAHVPKLVDHDVIAFDRESEIISKGEHADQILKSLAGFGGSTDSGQESHAGREYNE